MKILNNEQGFVMVVALVIMVVLTVIGIAANTNTQLELQIAGNERLHKQTFYAAEASAILSAEVLEQNLNCATGFSGNVNTNTDAALPAGSNDLVRVWSRTNGLAFWQNQLPSGGSTSGTCTVPDLTQMDISYPSSNIPPSNIPNGVNLSNVYVGGGSRMLPGGALQMAAGYERKGKSAAGGGVARYYDIISRHTGPVNSQSTVIFGWRHLVGSESACLY